MSYVITKQPDGDVNLGNLNGEFVSLSDSISDYAAGGYALIDGEAANTNNTPNLINVDLWKVLAAIPIGGQGGLSPVLNPTTKKLQILGQNTLASTTLGTAANYALLASAGISNTGNTVVAGGNIGSSPTTTITGFPPGVLTSPAAIDNTDAAVAEAALAAAITYYQGLTPTLSGLTNLSTGGNGSTVATYTAGNYFGAAGLTMPAGIILDAQGNVNAKFVFVAGTTINLASGQSVTLINGAQAANVTFVAGSAFTSVATSTVNGNILAVSGITLGGGTLNGRALVTTGPVTISAATAVTSPGGLGVSGAGTEVVAGTDLSGYVFNLLLLGY